MISNSTTSVLPNFITVGTPTTGIYIQDAITFCVIHWAGTAVTREQGGGDRVNGVFQELILRTSLKIRADTIASFCNTI